MTTDQDLTVLREPTGPHPPQPGADSAAASPAIETTDATFAQTPNILKQRFVLEQKLGSGGMGTVYQARDLRKVEARDRHPFVAVKVLNHDFRRHPEAFMALEREASKSQTLSHPNIVSIFDFDKDGDLPFITMEMLQGQELAKLLEQFPDGLPDEMAWPVIEGLLAGLRYAHEAGVVHADFKPGNVFVSTQNHPKILDFGIARAVQIHQPGMGDDTLFDPQRLAALTPAYASLEMLDGQTPEPADDLYSLGVVIHLILTGRHPFDRASARDAKTQGKKLVRIKRMSRRQWRGLERCLAFERAQRPAHVADVQQALTEAAPWRSRIVGVAMLGIAFALVVNSIQDEAELTEVKQEVRATTLLDAQSARLDTLLAVPKFNSGWHNSVLTEMQTLQGLEGAQALASGYGDRIAELYTAAVIDEPKLTRALSRYRNGVEFGPLGHAAAALKLRLENNIAAKLAEPEATLDYVLGLESAFKLAANRFPRHPRWAELNLAAVDVLEGLVAKSVASQDLSLAEEALSRLTPRMFLYPALQDLQAQLDAARNKEQRTEVQAQSRADAQEFSDALGNLFSGSCLRLDVAAVYQRFQALVLAFPGQQGLGMQRVDNEMTRCVNQLKSIDQDRAAKLQTDALLKFGLLPQLTALRLDACAHSYLVGNGIQAGRRGYCMDNLGVAHSGAPLPGPKLVVIPAQLDAPAFAIGKEEVSVTLLNEFCLATGRCDPASSLASAQGQQDVVAVGQLPATNISHDLATAFSRWLTERTGYTYRVPSVEEWRRAVADTQDPNRNCRVQLAGVERGLAPLLVDAGQAGKFGLVHALGNVREMALSSEGMFGMGGSFRDALEDCKPEHAVAISAVGDELTGLRLLREVSGG